jgi:hypothetical protein
MRSAEGRSCRSAAGTGAAARASAGSRAGRRIVRPRFRPAGRGRPPRPMSDPPPRSAPAGAGRAGGRSTISTTVVSAIRAAERLKVARASQSAASFGRNSAGTSPASSPKTICKLARRDDQRDADGEALDHRLGDDAHQAPRPEVSRDDQDHPGHEGRGQKPAHPVFGDHREDHDDEGAGRPADLHPAAADGRDQEPRHDRRHEALAGSAPEAMAMASDSGSATIATVIPARRSARNSRAYRSLAS